MKRFAWIIVILVAGCATSTSIVRVKDESVRAPSYTKIAVSAPYDDLQIRALVEGRFTEIVSSSGAECVKAMDILPPLRIYTGDEIAEAFRTNGVQALLVVAVTDFWNTYMSTAGTLVTEVASSHTSVDLTTAQWGRLTAVTTGGEMTTRYEPGVTLSQANVTLDARLFGVESGDSPRMLWRANSTTSGNYFTPDSRVLDAAAKQITSTLQDDGLLRYRRFAPGEVVVVSSLDQNTVLGCLSCDEWEKFSILDKYGPYGIDSPNSVWDRNGMFGSDTSDCSACNPKAKNPPIIIDCYGQEIGRLSLSPDFPANYKEETVQQWLRKKVCRVSKH
jgi:hypothetical protein